MKGDIHTVLDFMTLVPTAWVIYMIRFKLKSTYIDELDNFKIYYLVKTHLPFVLVFELATAWVIIIKLNTVTKK